jgi:F-type H+-transporting ATPase subunit b
MPQLDVSTWLPQLFWLAVSFIALYAIVSRIIIPRTGGVIAQRKSTIDADLAEAQKLKASSEAALKAYEASLADARGKASAKALETRNTEAAKASGALHKLDAELSAKASSADKAVTAAKVKAMGGIAALAADISADIVAALIGGKVTKAAALSAVAKAAK